MKNLRKAAHMGGLSFKNGIRLHEDSITMYMLNRFPTAYQLSILAQEEIGKAYLLEEHVWQNSVNGNGVDKNYEKMLISAITNHKTKQSWFSRQADDWGLRTPKFIKDIYSGKLDLDKQDSVYVGLTRTGREINLKGKFIVPDKRIKAKKVFESIRRVNDHLIILIEGCRRGTSSVDLEAIDKQLTAKLLKELEEKWPYKSRNTIKRLRQIRKFKREKPDYLSS